MQLDYQILNSSLLLLTFEIFSVHDAIWNPLKSFCALLNFIMKCGKSDNQMFQGFIVSLRFIADIYHDFFFIEHSNLVNANWFNNNNKKVMLFEVKLWCFDTTYQLEQFCICLNLCQEEQPQGCHRKIAIYLKSKIF